MKKHPSHSKRSSPVYACRVSNFRCSSRSVTGAWFVWRCSIVHSQIHNRTARGGRASRNRRLLELHSPRTRRTIRPRSRRAHDFGRLACHDARRESDERQRGGAPMIAADRYITVDEAVELTGVTAAELLARVELTPRSVLRLGRGELGRSKGRVVDAGPFSDRSENSNAPVRGRRGGARREARRAREQARPSRRRRRQCSSREPRHSHSAWHHPPREQAPRARSVRREGRHPRPRGIPPPLEPGGALMIRGVVDNTRGGSDER